MLKVFESLNLKLMYSGCVINDKGELCERSDLESKPICNFYISNVKKVKVIKNGEVNNIVFTITGIARGKHELPPIKVNSEELVSSKWLKKWGHYCEIYDNEKKNYRILKETIIALESEELESYENIGWHKINDRWVYLHRDGVIGDVEGKNVITSQELTLIRNIKLSEKDAYINSLEMLNCFNEKLILSLMSFSLTSILTSPLLAEKDIAPNFLLWISGYTGYGKTTFSSFITNLFEEGNLSRADSHKTNVLLPSLKKYRDSVFIIDDFGTSKSKTHEYSVITKVEDILRQLTDRNALKKGIEISEGMVLVTGERFFSQKPENQSTIYRTIRLKMDNMFNATEQDTYNSFAKQKYDEYKDMYFFQTSIYYYLHWASEKINGTLLSHYKKDFMTLREELSIQYSLNPRQTDAIAHQVNSFNFYVNYGMEKGFITPDTGNHLKNMSRRIFESILVDQVGEILDPQLEFFFNTLATKIMDKSLLIGKERYEFKPSQGVIGFIANESNEDILKIEWESLFNLIVKSNNKLRGIQKKSFGKKLVEHELILPAENNITFSLKEMSYNYQQSHRIIKFRLDKLKEVKEAIEHQHALKEIVYPQDECMENQEEPFESKYKTKKEFNKMVDDFVKRDKGRDYR